MTGDAQTKGPQSRCLHWWETSEDRRYEIRLKEGNMILVKLEPRKRARGHGHIRIGWMKSEFQEVQLDDVEVLMLEMVRMRAIQMALMDDWQAIHELVTGDR